MPSPIIPCLWFNNLASEAVSFYLSIFPNSSITSTQYYTDAGASIHGHAPGSVMLIAFEINGQSFTALNGGPQFKFSEAVSFQVMCEDQGEVDYYWGKLGEGGDPAKQILPKMITDPDRAAAARALQAMMDMKKLDIALLEKAFEGK